jgi:hypothetical protein
VSEQREDRLRDAQDFIDGFPLAQAVSSLLI